MLSNKVYLLEAHFGEHYLSPCWHYVAGIYSDPFEAEKAKKEYEKNIEVLKNTPCPFTRLDHLDPNKIFAHDKWQNQKEHAEEFKNVFIREYEINQTINF